MSLFPLLMTPQLHRLYALITAPVATPRALSPLWRLCLRPRLLLLHPFMMMLSTCLLYMMMPVLSLVVVVLLALPHVLVSLPMIPTCLA
jgi:hypothetical protein